MMEPKNIDKEMTVQVIDGAVYVALPVLFVDCPMWWQNLVRQHGIPVLVEAVFAEYDATVNWELTRLIFNTEEQYLMFLLRWS